MLYEVFEFGLPEELVKGVSNIELYEVDQGNKNDLDEQVCLAISIRKSIFLSESDHS